MYGLQDRRNSQFTRFKTTFSTASFILTKRPKQVFLCELGSKESEHLTIYIRSLKIAFVVLMSQEKANDGKRN